MYICVYTHTHTHIPVGRAWQPTPVFLPGETHVQRSLAGYSPSGSKSQDMTDYISVHIGIRLSILFQLLSIIGCYIILSIVPCAMQ